MPIKKNRRGRARTAPAPARAARAACAPDGSVNSLGDGVAQGS